METERDKEVIKSIGKHKMLSMEQIIELHFPSYHTCWRRMNKCLKPEGYINKDPFYIKVKPRGGKIALYRLEKYGKRKYKQLTGEKYKRPRWKFVHLEHLLELNWVLITLGMDFELEKDFGGIRADAYVGEIIELDMGTEGKREIQKKYRRYKRTGEGLIWISNRVKRLRKWCSEIGGRYIKKNKFVRKKKSSILRVKSTLK